MQNTCLEQTGVLCFFTAKDAVLPPSYVVFRFLCGHSPCFAFIHIFPPAHLLTFGVWYGTMIGGKICGKQTASDKEEPHGSSQ